MKHTNGEERKRNGITDRRTTTSNYSITSMANKVHRVMGKKAKLYTSNQIMHLGVAGRCPP